MAVYDSFIAGGLLRRVLAVSPDVSAAGQTTFPGAVMFVDISDYTKLAEQLCRDGTAGPERLGDVLRRAYAESVEAVESFGGEVAGFVGDAVIAYWPADDGRLAHALDQSRRCAQRLHQRFPITDTAGSPSPHLHIGLSAGNVWAARVGGSGQWHLLLAGATVHQASAAVANAGPGQTKVAPEAQQWLQPHTDASAGSYQRTQGRSLEIDDIAAEVPRSRWLLQYASEGYGDWAQQRRRLCALFVRIDGLEDTAPDALAAHQRAVVALHAAIAPHTGAPGTLLLDDKGLVFTACLGMPWDSQGDIHVRAVAAGLEAVRSLTSLGLGCAVGVAGGFGVCMQLAAPPRQYFWAVGEFMVVAAGLMVAAEQGVLCSDSVASRLRHRSTLSSLPALRFKGMDAPVHPHQVHALHDQPEHTLFGRETEQATLDRCLDDVSIGNGTVVWMVGEAGVGKTTLAQHVRRAATARGLTALWGTAGSVQFEVAYAAWRPVFAALLADASASDGQTQSERRARLGSLQHPELAPLINAVVPGFLDDTPASRTLAGQARADATSRLLSEVLAARTTGRFVLVLEDCHWMDSASWRLVRRVAQDHPQALLLLTSRPTPGEPEPVALSGLARYDLPLAGLRGEAISAIAHGVLDPFERADGARITATVDAIVEHSAGNPLFAREYALLWATRTGRHTDERIERRGDDDDQPVPDNVEGLIASRLDALSPAEALALKAASVIGDTFSIALVAEIYPGDPVRDALSDLLARLAERQLILRLDADGTTFSFQHALIRQVTYNQVAAAKLRHLHRDAAGALERLHAPDLRPLIATLAHHWRRAGDGHADRALTYTHQAAEQALAAGAFGEARYLIGLCMGLSDSGRLNVSILDRAQWHGELADALHGMGELETRSNAAHAALRLAGCHRPTTPFRLVAQSAARLCHMGLRYLARRSTPLTPPPHTMLVARAYRHSAEVSYFRDDMIGMICDCVGAVAFASRLAPSAVLVGAASELGGVLTVTGLRTAGESVLNLAIDMAERTSDKPAKAYAQMIKGLYYIGIGDWTQATGSTKICQDLCEEMEDRVNWTNAQAVRFWTSHHRWRPEDRAEATDAARKLRDRALETRNRQHRAWGDRCLAMCALRQSEAEASVEHARTALRSLGRTRARNERITSLGILALARWYAGDVRRARTNVRQAMRHVTQAKRPIGHGTLEGYSGLLTVAIDAYRDACTVDPAGVEAAAWREHVHGCLRVLKRYRRHFPIGEARYQRHLGDFNLVDGRAEEARRAYQAGATAAAPQRLGMAWDEQNCLAALMAVPRTGNRGRPVTTEGRWR